jgi:hypothetical protein
MKDGVILDLDTFGHLSIPIFMGLLGVGEQKVHVLISALLIIP